MRLVIIIGLASLIAFVGVPWIARHGSHGQFSSESLARFASMAESDADAEVPAEQYPYVVGALVVLDGDASSPRIDDAFSEIDIGARATSGDDVRTVIVIERGRATVADEVVFDGETGRALSTPPAVGTEATRFIICDTKDAHIVARATILCDGSASRVAAAIAKMPRIDENATGLFDLSRSLLKKKH